VSAGGPFQHWACVYDDDQQLVDTAAPFLAAGLAAGQPVLAVTTRANLELIGAAMGERAGDVDYAESAFFGRRPPQRVAAFYRYWTNRAKRRRAHPGRAGVGGAFGPRGRGLDADGVGAQRRARPRQRLDDLPV